MNKISVLVSCLLFCSVTYAQTIGIGEVTSIESKATTISNNRTRIAQLKSELPQLENAWKDKINRLKGELAQLYKDRDNLIADMKVGARCSQCGGWKSDFEKKGINFQKHLGEVKGYAIPASTTELENTRKRFREKIALKKVQIQNLEKGDAALIKKRSDITTLEQTNDQLCREITAHSKNYDTKVFDEAKSKHDNWMNALMKYVTGILIADDKITIYKDRVVRYEKEFREESEKIRERVKRKNAEQQEDKAQKITLNEQQIEKIQADRETHITPYKTKLNELNQSILRLNRQIAALNHSDSARGPLVMEQKQVAEQITALEKTIQDYETNAEAKITTLKNNNKKLSDEIWQLKTSLTQQQEQEIAKIKPVYDQKKAAAKQSEAAAATELAGARKTYAEKTTYYKKQNDTYYNLVVSESNRMLSAAKTVDCSVWNEVRGKVMTNWNKVFPCVNSLSTMAKPYSTNVFNAYCPGQSLSTYMSTYKSFLSGLSNEDRGAVQQNSNSDWFEKITR